MTYLKTLARVAGLGLCVVALSGTALADPGNGNGNGPATTPPGQEQKAETPAASVETQAPAPQAAAGQEQKAENQAQQAANKAESKPAVKTTAANSTAAKADGSRTGEDGGRRKKAESKPSREGRTVREQPVGQRAPPRHRLSPDGLSVEPVRRDQHPLHGLDACAQRHHGLASRHERSRTTSCSRIRPPGPARRTASPRLPAVRQYAPTTQVTHRRSRARPAGCPATATTTERVLVGI